MKNHNDHVQKAVAKNSLTHHINLIVGDWSGDGHDKTDVIEIKCNLSMKALQNAYKKGTKKVGFDFIKTVADDYEDGILPLKKWKKLEKLGCKVELETYDYESADEGYSLYSESFAELVLFICSLGEPKLKYKFVDKDYSNQWAIGGYGLFE